MQPTIQARVRALHQEAAEQVGRLTAELNACGPQGNRLIESRLDLHEGRCAAFVQVLELLDDGADAVCCGAGRLGEDHACEKDTAADATYLALLGARESLCSAQTHLPVTSWRTRLGHAIAHIDSVGAVACPDQWSVHDQTHRSRDQVEPLLADLRVNASRVPAEPLPQPGVRTVDLIGMPLPDCYSAPPEIAAMVLALVAVQRSQPDCHYDLQAQIDQAVRVVAAAQNPMGTWTAGDLYEAVTRVLGR